MDNILLKFIVGLILTIYITHFLKKNIKDPRPLGAKNCSGKNIDDRYMGFPSAHSAIYAYIFSFIAIHNSRFSILLFIISLSIAYWRINIKCHYIHQVIAGLILGYFIAKIVLY